MWTAALRGDPKTIKARSDQMHFEKGLEKGKAIGLEKARKEDILNMYYKAGLSPEQISSYLGVDLDQVLSIIKAG